MDWCRRHHIYESGLGASGQLLWVLSSRSPSAVPWPSQCIWLSCHGSYTSRRHQKAAGKSRGLAPGVPNASVSQRCPRLSGPVLSIWLCKSPVPWFSVISPTTWFFLPESSLFSSVQYWTANTFVNRCLKPVNSENLTRFLSEAHKCLYALFLHLPHQ